MVSTVKRGIGGSRSTLIAEDSVQSSQPMEGLKRQQEESKLETTIVPVSDEPALGVAGGKATGPRSPQGKERSKRNAIKHGVFSGVVLLPTEFRTAFNSLHKGLWEALQPEGKLEEVLVDKLATLLWRHRRLIIAEGAEIRNSVELMARDRQEKLRDQAETTSSGLSVYDLEGQIRYIDSPVVLEHCFKLLSDVRAIVERHGFQEENRDKLEVMYVASGYKHPTPNLYEEYLIFEKAASASEEERVRHGYASPDECKQSLLKRINEEIESLQRYEKTQGVIEADRMKLEALRRLVPESPSLDRLLRYEASLERSFDRTLSQLERLQRMRRGQPVPPPFKVELS